MIIEAFDLLGKRGRDKVTGLEGVVESISFNLYGEVMVALRPVQQFDGNISNAFWLQEQRIVIEDGERVIDVPDFDAVASKPE